MTSEMMAMDEFDGLLEDVLRVVANPELPERVRVWVRDGFGVVQPMSQRRDVGHPVLVPPGVFVDFQARMNPRRSTASTAWALGVHAAAIALIFWMVAARVHSVQLGKMAEMTELTPPPPMAQGKKEAMGGGGGQKSAAPVSKGELPKFAGRQITPPNAPPLEEPKIRMPEATIEAQKDLKIVDSNMPNMGMPSSALLGASMGNGSGTGIGAENGSGLGKGSGGNYGGGPKRIGGWVSAPVLTYQVDPEFSEEARRAKFMGVVTVSLIVDAQGRPQSVRVARGVGMGLDQKAVDAVKQYRFKPAMEAGRPVAVQMNVEVSFQIF